MLWRVAAAPASLASATASATTAAVFTVELAGVQASLRLQFLSQQVRQHDKCFIGVGPLFAFLLLLESGQILSEVLVLAHLV